jgi:hypothetical protein
MTVARRPRLGSFQSRRPILAGGRGGSGGAETPHKC